MFKRSAVRLMEFVSTKAAPPPAAPYAQATKFNGTLYVSGQIPLTPAGKVVEGDIKAKAQQCFENLDAILKAGGTSKENILKLNIFTTDISSFGPVNEAYVKYLEGHTPARSFVSVKELPLNMDVEVEGIAAITEK